jgi:hypothetical protein
LGVASMAGKEQSGKDKQVTKQPKPQPTAEGLDPQLAQAEAVSAAQKIMAMPRPPLDPDEILALQRTVGNQVVQRILDGEEVGPGQSISPMAGPDAIQRTNGGLADALSRGGTVPVNIARSVPFGGYAANIELHGQVRINPFSISLTGEPNGITITEGEEQRAQLQFRQDGSFQSLGVDLGDHALELDEEGRVTAESELGPVSMEWDGESEQLSVTLDVLGAVWPRAMQEMVEDVGEVTSDFNLTLNVPSEGAISLANIGMDLGISFGPEQVRAVAEFSVSTTYEEGLEYTEASGNVEVQINVFGIEETIPLYEDAASGTDLGIRHERQLVQTALRYAFLETYRDIQAEEAAPRRSDVALRDLQAGFNVWYEQGYGRARQSIIDRYAEQEIEEVRMHDGSSRRPLTSIGPGQVTMDTFCRENIRQVILPHPDPPGGEAVRAVWDNLLQPHFAGS